jgi:hypothetical protein
MNPILQPMTITDMRRDPKSLLARLKKEKVLPVLVHSRYEAAFVDIDELNRLYSEIKELKHRLFAEETLRAEQEVREGKGNGPFKSIDELMEHLDQISR